MSSYELNGSMKLVVNMAICRGLLLVVVEQQRTYTHKNIHVRL